MATSRKAPQIVSSLVLSALDLFAQKVKIARDEKDRTAVQRLAQQWKELDDADRAVVVEKISVVTELVAAAIPLAIAAAKARSSRRKHDARPRKKSKRKDETAFED
ncbi:MAG TPA: hypothetical protein VLU46_03045 [Thermoanaerobaculia bacterium]|nr:hypothetical protein [Thermoanaerobaculia bacterium]